MYVTKNGINHPEVLEHSFESVPEAVRQDIVSSRVDKGYKIRCCHFADGAMGGHLAHAIQEILYSQGLNGRQNVKYERGKEIEITPKGVSILKTIFSGSLTNL